MRRLMSRDLLQHFVEMRGVVVAAEFSSGLDESCTLVIPVGLLCLGHLCA